jgi:hypothetical protein
MWLSFVLGSFLVLIAPRRISSQSVNRAADAAKVVIDADDIGGIVSGTNGPEAGVWVIAETKDLPTKFRKIVVTDDKGRFVIPDLPKASYSVWVRGYGLVDSQPVPSSPGKTLALTSVPAPDARAAAQYYPANYWYSLIKIPSKSEFPGTGPEGNGISPEMKTQMTWIGQIKGGCIVCHQIGNKATREFPATLGHFSSSIEAWDHRFQVGQDGKLMSEAVSKLGRARGLQMFADWTDRVAAGEIPPAPPRPQGLERNLVLSEWEWGVPSSFVHDEVSTDRRKPTLNANGPIYGVDFGTDRLLILDTGKNAASYVKLPSTNTVSSKPQSMPEPSPYWGEEIYWTDPAHPGVGVVDQKARVWITSEVRPEDRQPDFCGPSSGNKYAKYFPLDKVKSSEQVAMYDPLTKEVTNVDTCFDTHHLQFDENADNTLYFSGRIGTVGWLNTKVYDQTGSSETAQGWCPTILDTNGDGKIGAYTEPNDPIDPRKDHRVMLGGYGIAVNPVDHSIWFAAPGTPGQIVRLDRGTNPPTSCKSEVYEPPFNNASAPGKEAYFPRGIDVDRNGLVWTGLSGSGQLASFDRRKCKVLNGPTATGQHCPEGWTLYTAPGPRMKGVPDESSADFFYFNKVDQYNALGLGPNTPMANGTLSDSLLVLQPDGKFLVLRVPYPIGFYSRGMDGRIDDPKTGWKGRAVYANYAPNSVWHIEGGKGTLSSLVKFQMRPDPLAK